MNNSPILVSDDGDLSVSSRIKSDLSGTQLYGNSNLTQTKSNDNPKKGLLSVDKTSSKDIKKNKTVKKKKSKKDKYESLPFWVNSPKDVREIPSHIKLVCDRLIHVEQQIKKFCIERQGLLSALWKLKGDGYGDLFPDPVSKSLTIYNIDEKPDEEETIKDNESTPESEVDEKLNYNDLKDTKMDEGDNNLWKSTWLINDSDGSPTRTPTIKKFTPRSNIRSDYSYDFGQVTSMLDSKQGTRSNPDENGESQECPREPVEFFKNLDFSTLSQYDINTWRKFFGLKRMAENELIKELEKIRDYLVSFVNT